jgi:hypothetical protein
MELQNCAFIIELGVLANTWSSYGNSESNLNTTAQYDSVFDNEIV